MNAALTVIAPLVVAVLTGLGVPVFLERRKAQRAAIADIAAVDAKRVEDARKAGLDTGIDLRGNNSMLFERVERLSARIEDMETKHAAQNSEWETKLAKANARIAEQDTTIKRQQHEIDDLRRQLGHQ